MSDEPALRAAILAHPDEDTPRLAYADWLDENGHPDRTEVMRAFHVPLTLHDDGSITHPPGVFRLGDNWYEMSWPDYAGEIRHGYVNGHVRHLGGDAVFRAGGGTVIDPEEADRLNSSYGRTGPAGVHFPGAADAGDFNPYSMYDNPELEELAAHAGVDARDADLALDGASHRLWEHHAGAGT